MGANALINILIVNLVRTVHEWIASMNTLILVKIIKQIKKNN